MSQICITGEFTETYKEAQEQWRIADFFSRSLLCYYDSPSFPFGEAFWCLRLFPGGSRESAKGFVSLYLTRKDDGPPKTLQLSFGIKNAKGEIQQINDSFRYTFEQDYVWGYRKFLKRSKLTESRTDLVPNDTLTIICTIQSGVSNTIQVQAIPLKLKELEALSEDFAALLDDARSCDITLRVQDKEFQAHKFVLVARSPVFSAMFRHDMSENETGVVSISDCHPDSFAHFLKYLYSGKVDSISFENAFHLYSTSDKYEVEKLKTFCVEYMKQNLTVKNVCEVISLSDQYDESELFTAAQTFFNKHFSEVLETAEWENLMKRDFHLGNQLIAEWASKAKMED